MATIIIPDKICPHCGGNKWSVENRKNPTKAEPNRRTIRYRCIAKAVERRRKWNTVHQDRLKEYTRQRDIKRIAEGYWKTPKMQAYFRSREQHYRDTITDKYVRYLWRRDQNNREYVLTPDEINIYREHLLIHRQIKQSKNGKKDHQNRN